MSVKRSPGLGKGFAVLMPDGIDSSLLSIDKNRIQNLYINHISASPDQPRSVFDKAALDELAESIKSLGILQPLIVTPADNPNSYRIIAGERRWRAAKLAGLERVPVIVRDSAELEELEIALVENIQRVDLNPLEQAVSIQRLHEQFSKSYDEIAERLGKASSTVHNIARLLQLPKAAREALHNEAITEGHARSILALRDKPEKQTELLKLIQQHGWSVRQAEQFVTATKKGSLSTTKAQARTAGETPETLKLSERIKAPVTIHRMAKGGRLIIRFQSENDLNRLYKTLGQP